MMIAAIALPALVFAVIALLLRSLLRSASWITWLGYTLIGTGVPVLAGQGGALVAISGGAPEQAPLLLASGLAGGLGWAAGALSARFTGAKDES